MKKTLQFLLLMAAMLAPGWALAQSLTVADGTNTNEYVPIYGWYADANQHNQIIYPASMLTAMTGSNITSMTFYMSQVASADWEISVTISLGIADDTSLNGQLNTTATLTEVWQGAASGMDAQWVIEFDEPYAYNGGNLLVDIQTITNGEYKRAYFYGISTDYYASHRQYSGSNNAPQQFLPKASFGYGTGVFCRRPTSLQFEDVTANSATATWTAANGETQFNVYLDGTLLDGMPTTATSYNFTGLNANTQYSVGVRAYCSADDSSNILTSQFKTLCGTMNLPFSENFDSYVYGVVPSCWQQVSGSVSVSSNQLYWYYYGEGIIATPPINAAANALTVTFMHQSSPLQVGVMPADGTADDIQWLYTINSSESNYTEHEFFTTEATEVDGDVRVVFGKTDYEGYNYVDNVVIGPLPTCFKPTTLSFSNVGPNSATISWTGTSDQYRVVWYATDTPDVKDSVTVSTTSYDLTGLTTQTGYTVTVYGVCGETDWSAARSITFTTTCDALTSLPVFTFEDGTVGEMPDCWQLLNGNAYVQDDGDGHQYLHLESQAAVATQPIAVASDSMTVSFKYTTNIRYGIVAAGGSLNDVQWIGYTDYPGDWSTATFFTEGIEISGNVSLVFYDENWNWPSIDSIVVLPFTGCKSPDQGWAVGDSTTDHSAFIVWNDAAAEQGYDVVLSTGSWNDDDAILVHTADTFATVTGLDENTSYNIYVRTLCNSYDVSWNNLGSIQTKPLYKRIGETSLDSRQYVSLRIYWYTNYTSESPIHQTVNYRVAIREQGATEWAEYDVNTYSSYHTFSGLDEGTTYEMRVAVVADDGAVLWGNSIFATTDACNVVAYGTNRNNYMPYMYNYYNASRYYSYTQQLYTADEMTNLGDTISGVTFFTNRNYYDTAILADHTVDVYLANVGTDTTSLSYSMYVPFENLTLVAQGATLEVNGGEAHIVFDSPFVRDNSMNLVVAVYDSSIVDNSDRYWRTTYASYRGIYKATSSQFTPEDATSGWSRNSYINTVRFDADECTLPDGCETPSLSRTETDTGYIFSSSVSRSDYYWNYDYRLYRDNNWYYPTEADQPWHTISADNNSGAYAMNTTQLRSDYQYTMRVWRESEQCDNTLMSSNQYFYGGCQVPSVYSSTTADGHYVLHWNGQAGAEYTIKYMENNNYTSFENATVLATGVTADTFLVDFDLPNDRYYYFYVSRTCGDDVVYGATTFYGNVQVPHLYLSYDNEQNGRIKIMWYSSSSWVYNPETGYSTQVYYYDHNVPYTISYRYDYATDDDYVVLDTPSDTNVYVLDFDLPGDYYYRFRVTRPCGDSILGSYQGISGNCSMSYINSNYTDSGMVYYWPTVNGAAYDMWLRNTETNDTTHMGTVIGDGNTFYSLFNGYPASGYYQFIVTRECGGVTYSNSRYFSGDVPGVDADYSYSDDGNTVYVYWDTVGGEMYCLLFRGDDNVWHVWSDSLQTDNVAITTLNFDRYYAFRVGRYCEHGISYGSTVEFNGTCQAPALNLVGGSTTTIELTWNGDGVTQYTLNLLDDNGNIVATAQPDATANTYTFTGLQPTTIYNATIARECYSGRVVNQLQVMTLCAPLEIPYSMNFQGWYYGNVGVTINCWRRGYITNDNTNEGLIGYGFASLGGSYKYVLRHGAYLMLPEFAKPLSELQVSFNLYAYPNAGNDSTYVIVGVTSDQDGLSDFEPLDTLRNSDFGSDQTVRAIYRFDENIDNSKPYVVLMAPIDTVNASYVIIEQVDVDEKPLCYEVHDVAVVSTTANSATLTWSAGEANTVEYVIEYGQKGFYPGDGQRVYSQTNSVVIPNLTQGTDYQAYVYANCGRVGMSDASSSVSFTTECAPVEYVSQNFDNSSLVGRLPNCWIGDTVTGAAMPMVNNYNYYYSDYYYYTRTGLVMDDGTVVALPEVIYSLDQYVFNMYVQQLSGIIEVGTVQHNGAGFGSTFVPIDTMEVAGTFTRYMDDVATDRHFYAIRVQGSAAIGSISLNGLPLCFPVENLHAVNVTSDAITIDWTDHVDADGWRITYSDDYYHDTVVYSHPVTLTNLNPNTGYYFYVYTRCGNSESDSRGVSANTMPLCSAPENLQVVSYTADSVTIDWEGSDNEVMQWTVEVNNRYGWDQYTVNSHPFTIATPYNGNYTISVYTICTDGYTTNQASITYTPECQAVTVTRNEPWSENFSDYYYLNDGQPYCWTENGVGRAQPANYYYQLGSTDDVLGDVRLVSPQFNLEDNAVLSFDYRAYYYYYPVTFQVEFLDANGQVVKTSDTIGNNYSYYTTFIDTMPHSCTQFAVHFFDTNDVPTSYRYMYLDNFYLQLITRTPCNYFYNMEVVDGTLTMQGAHLRLISSSLDTIVSGVELRVRENSGNYQYVEAPDGSYIFNTFDATDSSFVISNLKSTTEYLVEARFICDYDDIQGLRTAWEGIGLFNTPCDVVTSLPHTFYPTVESSCWLYDSTATFSYNSVYLAADGQVALTETSFGLDTAYVTFEAYDNAGNPDDVHSLVVGVMGSDGFVAVDTVDYYNNSYFESYFFGMDNYHRVAFKNLGGSVQLNNVVLHVRPACVAVQNLTVTDTGSSSVTLDWTSLDPSVDHWKVYNENNGITYDVTSKPYTVTGLQPGVYYWFAVYAACSETVTSNWENVDVTTTCGAIESLPYSADFSGYYEMPTCWSMDTVANAAYNQAYTQYDYYYLQGNVTVATPQINLNLDSARLTFYVYLSNNDGSEHILEVGVVDSVNDGFAASFQPLYTISSYNYSNNNTVYFDGIGSGKYIAMRTTSPEGSSSRFRVSSFNLLGLPECSDITNLRQVDATATSVTVDWDDRSTENPGWIIEYYTPNYGWRQDSVFTHPVTINGLQHTSNYNIYVRSICYGSWRGITATTECGVATELPITCDFEGGYSYSSYPANLTGVMPNCWGYDASTVDSNMVVPQISYWNYNGFRLLMGGNELVYGPEYQSGIQHYNVEFSLYYVEDVSYGDTAKVIIGTYNNGQFTALDTVTYYGTDYGETFQRHIVADMSGGARFAFKAMSDNYFMLDDVTISRAPSCEGPDTIWVVDATMGSVTLDWNGGNASQWEVSYNMNGYNLTKTVTEHPYTVTSLRPGNYYNFRVRAVCGEDDYTDYIGVYAATDCDVVTALPVMYTFDNNQEGQLPNCWAYDPGASVIDSNNAYASEPTLLWYSSTNGLVLTMDYTGTLAMPVMTVPVNTLTVEYDVVEAAGNDGMLIVGLVDGNAEGFDATFVPKDTLHYSAADILGHHSTTFDAATGDRVAFRTVGSTTEWNYVVIDNVTVSTSMDPCVTADSMWVESVGVNDVTLAWEADGSNADAWEIALLSNTTYDYYVVNSSPATISGLERGTNYNAYIRPICTSDSVRGVYGYNVHFTTPYCTAPAPTGLAVGVNSDTVTLSWNKTNATDSMWYIRAYLTAADPTVMLMYGLDSALVARGDYYYWGYYADSMPYTFTLPNNCSFNVMVATFCDPDNDAIGTMSDGVPVTTGAADCPEFSNIAITSLSDQSVTFTWTDGYSDNSRRVVVVPTGDDLASGYWVSSNWVDTTVATLNGLEPLTTYDFYIYTWCTGTYMKISEPYTFTTTGICHTPTNLTATDTTATSITVSWNTQAASTIVAIAMGNELPADAEGTTVTVKNYTFSDLLPDNVYTIGVRSECESNWHTITLSTDTLASGDTIVCNEPSALAATSVTATSITVGWTTEAATTQLGIATAAAWPNDSVIAMSSTNSYTFGNLLPETEYTIGVRSLCSEGWVTINVTTAACPNVTAVTVTNVTTTTATVAWTDATASTYRVEYGVAGFTQGSGTVQNAAVNPYIITGLEPATNYDVYVLRQCVGDIWEVSDVATFTTEAPCYAPTAFAVTDTSTTSISVSWTTQADSTLVAISAGANPTTYEIVAGTTYTFTGLTPATGYTVWLRSACETSWHSYVVTTKEDTTYVCPNPTDLITSSTAHTVTASWTTTAALSVVAISQGATLGADAQTFQTSAATYTFQGLQASTQYTVGVRSQCSDVWITSTLTTAEEQDTTVVTCPDYSNLTATVNTTSLTATWTTTADSSKVGICQGSSWIASTTMTKVYGASKTFNGLQPSTTYTIAVKSYCNDTLLTYTVTTLDSVADVCNMPQNVSVTNVTNTTATVGWTGVSGAEGYEVRLTRGSNVTTVTSNVPTYTFTGLTADQTYSVAVRTVCDAASQSYSEWSNAVSFTTLTGIEDVTGTASIELYPNPASTEANITVSGVAGIVRVAVVDMNGRTVRTFEAEADRTVKVDVSNLAQGAYFVRVLGSDVNVIRKLIVR